MVHFGRNSIIPDSISFSLLIPGQRKGNPLPVRTSTPLSGSFVLPRIRSTGFESQSSDLRTFTRRPSRLAPLRTIAFAAVACGSPHLTSPLPCSPWPVFQNVRYDAVALQPFGAVLSYHRAVSDSFQRFLQLLLNVPSLYYTLSGLRSV